MPRSRTFRSSCARSEARAGRGVGMNFSGELRHGAGLHQRSPNRVAHKIVHNRLLAESDLRLRRMDVYIYLRIGQLQKNQDYGINRRRKDVAISLGKRMLDEPITDQTPVHKHKNRITIQLLDFRLGNKSMNAQLAKPRGTTFFLLFCSAPGWRLRQANVFERLHRGHRNHLFESFFTEHLVHTLAVIRHRRRNQQGVGCRMQLEMFVRMSQRVMRHQ